MAEGCKYRGHTERPGLYLMVGFTLYATCNHSDSLNRIENMQKEQRTQIQEQNILGGEANERFYDINGQRAYLEIDDKLVYKYFNTNGILERE
jgi:hypothetical protein